MRRWAALAAAGVLSIAAAAWLIAGVMQPVGQRKISAVDAAILGVVEGLTEYLPISSTGHLIIVSHALGLISQSGQEGWIGPQFQKVPAIAAFEIVIQAGAIVAVLGLYRHRVAQMFRGLLGRDKRGLRLLGLLMVAFGPAAVAGWLLHQSIEEHLFAPLPVAYALAAGGVLMIVVEHFFHRHRPPGKELVGDVCDVAFWQALVIGAAQCLAMWPGTSRSMVTILAGVVVGLKMVTAAEFSFLLALPTLGAATVYSGVKDYDALLASAGWEGLFIGMAVSAAVAAIAVKGFVRWLTRHGLTPFGVYRLLLAGVVVWYFLR